MATTALPQSRPAYRSRAYEWLTTVDHKKIGVMYIVTAFSFFLLGGILALFIRSELAVPGLQFLDEATYNQLFGMHAVIMIFLFVMPMTTGLANYIVPLQIGAADMAFPRINALSFWLLLGGGALILLAFVFGGAPVGWTMYAPLSVQEQATGVDLLILGLILAGTSSLLGAINFLVTIFRMRAPGMTLLRLPMFGWTTLVTSVLLVFSIPVITAGLVMLFIDRNYGGGFFDPAQGGNPILWQHVFWFFGHPEVYILILPAFGIISEILPVFSRKPLFGYKAFVFATAAIGALGFSVWAHHMFTTGAVYLPFFSFFTFLIAVPTGIKFFNWLGTMWGGQLTLQDADAVRGGLHHPVPDRRPRRRLPGGRALRLHGPGHLLGRQPHPLRARGGRGVRDLRGAVLLVPQDVRPATWMSAWARSSSGCCSSAPTWPSSPSTCWAWTA